jgi:hypothetical protein
MLAFRCCSTSSFTWLLCMLYKGIVKHEEAEKAITLIGDDRIDWESDY